MHGATIKMTIITLLTSLNVVYYAMFIIPKACKLQNPVTNEDNTEVLIFRL